MSLPIRHRRISWLRTGMRTIIGILIASLSFLIAFGMAAGGGHGIGEMIAQMNFGAAGGLIHATEIIGIGGILMGGLMVSFRPVDLFAMLHASFTQRESSPKELRTNILICQAASRLVLFSGMAAAVAGVIIVMMFRLGGDTSLVGQGIATALSGVLWGILGAALFSTLKSRFLHQMNPGEQP